MLIRQILRNWDDDVVGKAQRIDSLCQTPWPAWTIRYSDGFGVALPLNDDREILERFSGVILLSDKLIVDVNNQIKQNVLVLKTNLIGAEDLFASLCAQFIDPGLNGEKREEILASPQSWWMKWKELIGNRNINERIYDVLGELIVFYLLLHNHHDASWNGPERATYDIETENRFFEVKSTTLRSNKEITISNNFQLQPPGKPLDICHCIFESSHNTGHSINSIVERIVSLGYNRDYLNKKLLNLGFDVGMSCREIKFILHDLNVYHVDAEFPRITPESFKDSVMPKGITKVIYTVDLSGLTSEKMLGFEVLNS